MRGGLPSGWSAARALAWESLRLSWRPVLSITLAACALAAVYWRLLAPFGERRDAEVFSSLLVLMSLVYSTALLACRDDGLEVGFERRLFRLPLSTLFLVVGRLAPALLFVTAMQAAVTLFMRSAFGAQWPLLGPGLLVVTVASWTLALTWSCGRRPLAIAPLGALLLIALLAWLRPLLSADPLWSLFAMGDAAILGIATALAVIVAVWGVARQRQAGAAARPHRRASRSLTGATSGSMLPPPRSALRSQLWMEWREKGRWFPYGMLLWLVAGVAGGAVPVPDTGAMLGQALHDFLPFALLMLPPVAGFFHGSFRLTSRVAGIDGFRATRPLGDRDLAYVILLSAARACAAGWAATFAGVAALALGLWQFGDTARVEEIGRGIAAAVVEFGAGRFALATVLLAAAAWAALGLVAAVALCGRNWLSMLAFPLPLVAVSGLIIGDLAGFDLLAHAGPALLVPFGVLTPLGMAAAWAQAVRQRLVPVRSAARVALFWAGSTVLLLWLLPAVFATPLAAGEPLLQWLWLAALGLAAAVFLPAALAPLALRWNRHR